MVWWMFTPKRGTYVSLINLKTMEEGRWVRGDRGKGGY